MRVRIRGIYATALTRAVLSAGHEVVNGSEPIQERFDADIPTDVPLVAIEDSDDRQGVGLRGEPAAVGDAIDLLEDVGRDAFAWADPAPRGAIFQARVTETLGSGAVCELGTPGSSAHPDRTAPFPADTADGGRVEGFLPFDRTDQHVTVGDRLRVQVTDPAQPWSDHRPEVDTAIRATAGLVTLVRGREGTTVSTRDDAAGRELAGITDLLDLTPPEGWGIRWEDPATGADLEVLSDALDAAVERASAIEASLSDHSGDAPTTIARPQSGAWVWFGRESRFELDERRRAVSPTMPGHHRIKAGDPAASAGVDLAEALCEPAGDEEFPFEVVTRQFGPRAGDSVRIEHGKPDGRVIDLGRAEVTDLEADGTVTVRRELTGGGRYDALDVPKEDGDVAVTTVREGRWWYPTVYRDDDGTHKGTYVNVCTPVECFPSAIRYVDLHVDVIKRATGDVERVDDDELDAAVDAGYVSPALADRARSVAAALADGL